MPAMVSFLPASPAQPPDCPCGTRSGLGPADRRAHAIQHMRWAIGVPIPAALQTAWPPATIAVVILASPVAWRRLAYELAQVARRQGRYDTASFPVPLGRGRPNYDPARTRALLYRHHDMAAGYLVLVDEPTTGRYNLRTRQSIDAGRGTIRPTVVLVFVACHLRRAGIGQALVQAAAEHAQITPAELAWWSPFTDDGARVRPCARRA